jgi:hypothetical protein
MVVPVTAPPFGEPPIVHPSPNEIAMLQEAAEAPRRVRGRGRGREGLPGDRAQAPPADALLTEAQDADLLVVGSRRLGGFTGLMLGSARLLGLHMSGAAHLTRRDNGRFGFVAIELTAAIWTDPELVLEAERAARDAEDACLVADALDVPVHVDTAVHATPVRIVG